MEISLNIKYLVGIDEAGRGALAGPVSVGMFVWPLSAGRLEEALADYPLGRDSKKLTPKMRDKWFARIMELAKESGAICQVSFVDNKYIDRAGIVLAVTNGIKACLEKLEKPAGENLATKFSPAETLILLDGGLRAPDIFPNQQTIIKGDEKELVISLASILAKVSRDRKMIKMAEDYPNYDFIKHKGYGTSLHYKKIAKHGVSAIHRQSYIHK